jgi:hypothetical protein
MSRPTGVTVLAILAFCFATFLLLAGLFVTLVGTAVGAAGGPLLAALGAFAGIVMIVFALLEALVGYGLWTLKGWAWMLTVILAGLGLAMNVLQMLSGEIFGAMFGLAINGVILWYMMQPHVKAAFGRI